MRIEHSKRMVAALSLSDSVMIALSFIASYFLRFYSGLPVPAGIQPFALYAQALLVVIPIFLWLFHEAGLYQPSRRIRRVEEIFLVIKVSTYGAVLLTAITFFYREFEGSRLFLLFFWFFSCFLISVGRYEVIQWGYWRRRRKKDQIEVLMIGLNRNTLSLIDWMQSNPHYGQKPVGILAANAEDVGKLVSGVRVLGPAEHWETFIKELRPGRVVLLDEGFSREKVTDLVAACEDALIDFKMAADIHGLISSNVGVEYISRVPLLGFRALPLDDPWNRFLKRSFDIIVAGAMMLCFLPFGLLIAALIKAVDRAPVLYLQERTGRDGKVFRLFKFRTMKVNAEDATGPVRTKPGDDRRTPIGRFLRRWNLDELPQLLNVLRGDMSLVGPRPERPHFVGQFREKVPRYMARHKVKAGLTGWAQVHGLRGETSIEERIKYDLYYLENWSLLLDVEILVMTLFAFKNAY